MSAALDIHPSLFLSQPPRGCGEVTPRLSRGINALTPQRRLADRTWIPHRHVQTGRPLVRCEATATTTATASSTVAGPLRPQVTHHRSRRPGNETALIGVPTPTCRSPHHETHVSFQG